MLPSTRRAPLKDKDEVRWVRRAAGEAVRLVCRKVAAAPLLWLLVAAPLALALIRAPTAYGDSGEYFMMIESLYNHWTPDARPGDFSTLGRAAVQHHFRGGYGPILSIYQVCPEGRYYSIHFWMYPLFTLPAKFALRVFHLNELTSAPRSRTRRCSLWFWFRSTGPHASRPVRRAT